MHQLGYFDILPLYVVLMLAAPDRSDRQVCAAPAVADVAGALFRLLTVPFTAPTWPVTGQWFFNPFTWQAIFVLGFALSRDGELEHFVRRHIRVIRMIALPIVLLSAVVVWFNLMPDPTKLPEPKLLFLNGKSFLTPMRLIQFRRSPRYFRRLIPCLRPGCRGSPSSYRAGRNSLNVFCVASLLSLLGQIVATSTRGR